VTASKPIFANPVAAVYDRRPALTERRYSSS
jgi:hypothetical protein